MEPTTVSATEQSTKLTRSDIRVALRPSILVAEGTARGSSYAKAGQTKMISYCPAEFRLRIAVDDVIIQSILYDTAHEDGLDKAVAFYNNL